MPILNNTNNIIGKSAVLHVNAKQRIPNNS